jgi:hypothetical protein
LYVSSPSVNLLAVSISSDTVLGLALPISSTRSVRRRPLEKHLLLFCRRRLLLSFLLHSSVVYKNVMFRLSAIRMTWLLLAMLGAYMLSESFSRIDSLILPNFQWNRWVGYLTRTVLRRWGVTTNFAWLLLLFLLVSVLLAGNLITTELALAIHHSFLGHMAT